MKYKKEIILGSLLMSIIVCGSSFQNEDKRAEAMKLINLKSQFVVVEVQDGQIRFYDRFLEKQMKGRGILIPPAMRGQYEGKAEVRLGDKDFLKAFQEIYVPAVFDPEVFAWKNLSE